MRACAAGWRRRLLAASLLLFAGIAAALGAGIVWDHRFDAPGADLVPVEGAAAGEPADGFPAGSSGNLPFSAFAMLDGFSDYKRGFIPRGFESEAVGPGDLECREVYSSQGIVGMECAGSASQTAERIADVLQRKGWVPAASDGPSGSMGFAKDHGRYRWLHCVCSEVSGSASVWFAYSVSEE